MHIHSTNRIYLLIALSEYVLTDLFIAICIVFCSGQLLRANNPTWKRVISQIEPILQQRNDFSPTSSTFNISEFYDRTGHALHGGMLKQCKYRGGRCESKRWSTVRKFNQGLMSGGTADNNKTIVK